MCLANILYRCRPGVVAHEVVPLTSALAILCLTRSVIEYDSSDLRYNECFVQQMIFSLYNKQVFTHMEYVHMLLCEVQAILYAIICYYMRCKLYHILLDEV